MLYVVGTPIGNLGDITLRALETLKKADVILCEDTRHSLKLLNFYEIKKPLVAYHKFNEREATERVLALLREGKEVALISDAGMPLVSDPGAVLVARMKEEGLPFTVIPGTTAFVPALILSGFSAPFLFFGFLFFGRVFNLRVPVFPVRHRPCFCAAFCLRVPVFRAVFFMFPRDVIPRGTLFLPAQRIYSRAAIFDLKQNVLRFSRVGF